MKETNKAQMEEDRNRSSEGSSSRSRSSLMESLSLEINKYPRDLLQRFIGTQQHRKKQTSSEEEEEEEEEAEEIELNLGLSLGGRFGVDKTPKKLTRSSSIIGTVPLVRDNDSAEFITRTSTPASAYPVLMRSSSLPTETEEEWRKRKEMQSLRRMEAKRRRTEKQRTSSSSTFTEEERSKPGVVGAVSVNRCSNLQQQLCSQGSLESLGGSSSVMSELENKPFQG